MPEEYEARGYCADSPEEYWQTEDDCHNTEWSHGNNWNTDDVPDGLFMGNDLYLEDNSSKEYYTYNTGSIDHFSHLLSYSYDCDS